MNEVKAELLSKLKQAAGEELTGQDLRESPVADYGSPIAFKLAKKLKRPPQDIAAEVAGKIGAGGFLREVSAESGYINFELDYSEVAKLLINKKDCPGESGGKIILEHTSVNPTGPVHVGRIRNTVIGDSLRRILAHIGCDVETHYYVNDIGKQIAIIAQGIDEGVQPDGALIEKYGGYAHRPDYETFFIYVSANAIFEEDAGFQQRVQSLIQAAEAGDGVALNKITSVAKRCLSGQLSTYERLGVSFDVFDYESDGLRDGSVDKVLAKVQASPHHRKNEFGEGIDLSPFGIVKRGGMSHLLRSDGTSVYLARDLAYHLKKLELGDRIINVLGEDHKLEFAELTTILKEVFKVKKPLDVVHFSFVSFEGVKLSTRRGEIAAVDELLDEAVAKALEEVRARELGDEDTARMVGLGAVRFHIVKTTPGKQITFRWGEALDFEGESAPYIQYAHARSCRILEKSGADISALADIDYAVTEKQEVQLILALLDFPDVLAEAAEQLRPDLLATYLIELTAAYGRFYIGCPVLDSAGGVRNRRLHLVARVRDTVRDGLGLLGIQAPVRM